MSGEGCEARFNAVEKRQTEQAEDIREIRKDMGQIKYLMVIAIVIGAPKLLEMFF